MAQSSSPRTNAPRPALTRFARILLTLGSGESPWLIIAFVLGVTALGVFANFVYDTVLAPGQLAWEAALRVLIAVTVLISLAYAAYRYDLRLAWQGQNIRADFDENRLAPPHAGLIWLLSPGKLDLPLFAIRHHAKGLAEQRLRHCWMLITPGAQETYERLIVRTDELGYEVSFHPIDLKAVSIEASYRAIDNIYATEAELAGLKPEQIIADLTGGLKPMTAGMVLACLPSGRALEYIESERDDQGRPIEGTQRAVLVGVDFSLHA